MCSDFFHSSELGLLHPLTRRRVCSRHPLVQGGRYTLARGRGNGGPHSNEGAETIVLELYTIHICSSPLYIEKVLEGSWVKFFSLVANRGTASLRKREGGGAISKDGALVKKKENFLHL